MLKTFKFIQRNVKKFHFSQNSYCYHINHSKFCTVSRNDKTNRTYGERTSNVYERKKNRAKNANNETVAIQKSISDINELSRMKFIVINMKNPDQIRNYFKKICSSWKDDYPR